MPRQRSEKRQQAFDMWKDSGGTMMLKDIAAALNISDDQVRQWKKKDNWDDELNSHVTNDVIIHADRDPVTGRLLPGNKVAKGYGPPKGSKNALGNRGGHGGPPGNQRALKHGLRSKILPDDPEVHEIFDSLDQMNSLDMLWWNIKIQMTQIMRAQRLMYVKDQEDIKKHLKREKDGETISEREWEFQYPWDRHANFLQAQSRAIHELQLLIARYEEMLLKDLHTEEQQLSIEKLKAELDKIKNPDGNRDMLIQVKVKKHAAD